MNKNKIVLRVGSLLIVALLLVSALILYPINAVASEIEPTANWEPDENGIYSIGSVADLLAFAVNAEANSWYKNKIVQLTANIDMTGVSWITPEKFRGFFEGNGYAISNLNLENSEGELAFVGTLDGATFRNIQFINGSVTLSGAGVHLAGVIAVSVDGADCSFENVYTKMTLTTPTTETCRVGGMVAYVGYGSNVSFKNCLSECTLYGYKSLGGFVGATGYASNVTFTDCVFAGTIEKATGEAGGFIGRAVGNVTLTRCVSMGRDHSYSRQRGSFLYLDTLDFEEGDQSLKSASVISLVDCYAAHGNTTQLAIGVNSVRNHFSVTVKYTGESKLAYTLSDGQLDPEIASQALKKLAVGTTVSLAKDSFAQNYAVLATGLVATDEIVVYGKNGENELTICKVMPLTVLDMMDGEFTAGPFPEMPEDPVDDPYNEPDDGKDDDKNTNTQGGDITITKTVKDPNIGLIVLFSVVIAGAIAAAVILVLKKKTLVIRIVCIVVAVGITAGGVVGISFAANRTEKIQETVDNGYKDNANDEGDLVSKVPADLTCVGEDVRILVPYDDEFDTDENSTAIIDQAVIERNQNVEGRLGIELTYTPNTGKVQTDHITNIRTSVMSGTNSYDVIGATAYYGAALAAEGLYYDLNTDDEHNYISSDMPWYNQSFVTETSYRDQLYYIVGDLTTSVPDRTPVTYFNENLLDEYDIDVDLYQMALDGKWTVEQLKVLIENVYVEMDNADGKTKGDLHGLFFNGGSMCVDAMLIAFGINLSGKDDDGMIQLTYMDGNAVDAFESLYKLMYETDGVFLGNVAGDAYYGTDTGYYSEQAFFEKRALFAFGQIRAAKVFARDITLKYGMLPLPKYTETQRNYSTTPQDGYTILAIPQNIGNRLELATATLEILSEYSYSTVRPVYYDVAYKTRYASSEQTALLFDTIVESIGFNFVTLYSNSLGDPVKLMRARLVGDSGTQANSNLNRFNILYETQIQTYLNDLLEEFDKR